MADVNRTRSDLTTLFRDNVAGDISAQDGRDLIQSVFGVVIGRDPNAVDENANTNGTGQFLDEGNVWFNSTAKTWWICDDGTPMNAVWRRLMRAGDPAGGRLAGTFPNPLLAASGVTPGVYGDASHYAVLAVNADGTLASAAQFANPSGITSVGLVLPGELNVTGSPVMPPSGTLTAAWNSAGAGLVFATPALSSGVPALRALVVHDIPAPLSPQHIPTSGRTQYLYIPGSPGASGVHKRWYIASLWNTIAFGSGLATLFGDNIYAFPMTRNNGTIDQISVWGTTGLITNVVKSRFGFYNTTALNNPYPLRLQFDSGDLIWTGGAAQVQILTLATPFTLTDDCAWLVMALGGTIALGFEPEVIHLEQSDDNEQIGFGGLSDSDWTMGIEAPLHWGVGWVTPFTYGALPDPFPLDINDSTVLMLDNHSLTMPAIAFHFSS
jgi:hypothetical protein